MTARESLAQQEKREIDRQLDRELEDTFPASDAPKTSRFCATSYAATDDPRRSARVPKQRPGTAQSCDVQSASADGAQDAAAPMKQ